jgi:hypothetical protein
MYQPVMGGGKYFFINFYSVFPCRVVEPEPDPEPQE